MTIQAQLPDSPAQALAHVDRPTAAVGVQGSGVRDALGLLDHRTRSRTVSWARATPARYVAVRQGAAEHLIPLSRPITHIGRGLAADIRIADPHVSRRHAILAQRGDGVRLLDDRSANGTFVNGREVQIASLHDGDVIRVGPVVLRFVDVRPAFRSPPSQRIPVGLLTVPRPREGRAA